MRKPRMKYKIIKHFSTRYDGENYKECIQKFKDIVLEAAQKADVRIIKGKHDVIPDRPVLSLVHAEHPSPAEERPLIAVCYGITWEELVGRWTGAVKFVYDGD